MLNKRYRKPKGQSNGQFRDTGNIGNTRHRMKTI